MQRRPGGVGFAVLLGLSACGGRAVVGEFGVAELRIVSITPADGAVDVEPDAEITVRFNQPVEAVTAADLVVSADGAALAGSLAPLVDGVFWRFRAAEELPRGAVVEVLVPGGLVAPSGAETSADVSSTFRVREALPVATLTLPTESIGEVMMWPGGRALVTSGGGERGFEVVGAGLVERFDFPRSGDLVYGDGAYIGRRSAPNGDVSFVRGDLGQVEQPLALVANGSSLHAVNPRGDGVATVAGPGGYLVARLPADAPELVELGPLPGPSVAWPLSIAEDGAVVVGYVTADGQPSVARYAPQSTAPVHARLPRAPAAGYAAFGVAADGTGTLAWIEESERVRFARYDPVAGLTPLAVTVPVPEELPTWAASTLTLQVARTGSAVVHLAVPPRTRWVLRLEVDGSLGRFERWVRQLPGGWTWRTTFAPERGEWQAAVPVSPTAGVAALASVRSRPFARLDPARILYQLPLSYAQPAFRYGIDDLGRAVLGVKQASFPPTLIVFR